MKAGVMAAGNGARIRSDAKTLKPLVCVAGRPMIERVLYSLGEAGATEVTVIINEESIAVRDLVATKEWPFALRWLIETTPSSMHSFLRLVETLAASDERGPFLISTVDTMAAPEIFQRFYAEAKVNAADVTLALTPVVDDEKPLYARCDLATGRIEALGKVAANSGDVTAGLYAVRPEILREADAARADGLQALRDFLGRLLERGYILRGIKVGATIDVDLLSDVAKAEALLK